MTDLFLSIWKTFQEASFYLLIGYGLATILHIYLSPEKLASLLGRNRFGSILKATLYGIPLPLCSCAVLPSAISLKKKGVRDGTIFAYLIATPESGIDSIAVTYGLLGWSFALFRVMAAFVIAITTGSLIELLASLDSLPAVSGDNHGVNCDCPEHAEKTREHSFAAWTADFKRNFYDLFDETAGWLLLGLVLSGFIDYLIPSGFFQRPYFSGIYAYLLMLIIGLPMYICASASTPIAAMLIYKGLSPGAALVFLIAGPATNLGSLLLLFKTFGRRVVYYYLVIISILTLLGGYLLDSLQTVFPVDFSPFEALQNGGSLWESLFAVLFIWLIIDSFSRTNSYQKAAETLEQASGIKFTPKRMAAVLIVFLVSWYLSTGIMIVQANRSGVIEFFGKPHAQVYRPGLYLHYPYPIEIHRTINPNRVRSLNIGFKRWRNKPGKGKARSAAKFFRTVKRDEESFYLTADENIIDIGANLQYRVKEVMNFLYLSAEPKQLLKETARSALTEVMASYPIDLIYTIKRKEIEKSVLDRLQRSSDQYGLGVGILSFNLLNVHAPGELHYAFRDVASAWEDKETTVYQALGYAGKVANLAKGEAEKLILSAKAKRFEAVEVSKGETSKFLLNQAEYAKNPPSMRFQLYRKKMEQVLKNPVKIVSFELINDFDLWLSPANVKAPKKHKLTGKRSD